jgi:1-deoxy-D-xylulose-5-phosphate synthase
MTDDPGITLAAHGASAAEGTPDCLASTLRRPTQQSRRVVPAGQRRRAQRADTISLADIDDPQALRRLGMAELQSLANALRTHLLHSVSASGGHLSSSLGVVELAVALHHVFETPRDHVLWDVGHQGYPHKILTGRRDALGTIRRRGGLSGFLRREESSYDSFGAGHSSTSISAALGFALASAARREARRAVAVIGDGALTAGMAFEALQHAGASGADLLVVLNDNGMSISPNVGALHECLQRSRSDPPPPTGASAAQLFESLGIRYSGPIDGHDLPAVVRALRRQRALRGPRLLHVITQKGHGYPLAESDPVKYHGVTSFDPRVGLTSSAAARTFTQVFGDWLCDTAAIREDVVAITPAMREGSGLVRFAREFPSRYFDVGIAEQHSVTLAAGMACGGLRPVVAIYSTFLQRAYDQLIHDVAIQQLPVLFAIDRAGLVGPDGATHNGAFDLAFLRCVPGLTIMTPSSATELRAMLSLGLTLPGSAAVRYPRDTALDDAATATPQTPLELGRARLARAGSGAALLVFGTLLPAALAAAEELDATVIDMRFVAPLDTAAVLAAAATHGLVVTIEDNVVTGGAGSAVNECLLAAAARTNVLNLGLPGRFMEHGTRQELLRDAGLDAAGLQSAITARLNAMR